MPDVRRQSGRTSGLGYAKQSAQGTYAAPTDILNAASFDFQDGERSESVMSLNGQIFAESETGAIPPKLSGKLSAPLRAIQGMGIWKSGFGQDIRSGASATAFPTVTATAGSNTYTLGSAAPAVPTGCASWKGFILTVDTGASQEDVLIFGISGTTLTGTPAQFNHTTATATLAVQHAFQPNTGSNLGLNDYVSFCAQWSHVTERQIVDALISGLTIKNTTARLDIDADMVLCSDYDYDGAVTTDLTAVGSGSERGDTGWRLHHGALWTYGAAGDTVPQKHGRLQNFQYSMKYAVQDTLENNPVYQYVLGSGTQELTWEDTQGEAAFSTFYTDFVKGRRTTPAYLWFRNPDTGNSIVIFMPLCQVMSYPMPQADDKAVTRQGKIVPLNDLATEGTPFRVVVKNGVTAQY